MGPMSDSSGDEEATVCPDDQSIGVGMDDLTLGYQINKSVNAIKQVNHGLVLCDIVFVGFSRILICCAAQSANQNTYLSKTNP